MFTDPQYNVPIQGDLTKRTDYREFAMASGEMTLQEFADFFERSYRLMYEAAGEEAIYFVCMHWRLLWEILAAAAPVFGNPKQLCVWAKDNVGMGSFYKNLAQGYATESCAISIWENSLEHQTNMVLPDVKSNGAASAAGGDSRYWCLVLGDGRKGLSGQLLKELFASGAERCSPSRNQVQLVRDAY